MNRNSIMVLASVLLLVGGAFTVLQMNEDPLRDLKMTILGDRVKEVNYQESANYTINVNNDGEITRNIKLKLTDVPENWNASVDSKYVSVSPGEQKRVVLTVTSPSVETAGTRGISDVASVGVRGGNATIGTITILKGSAIVKRNNTIFSLSSGNKILSGDKITTIGNSSVSLDGSLLFASDGMHTGNISVYMRNSVVFFLKWHDITFMAVQRGFVMVKSSGRGGGGGKAEAPAVLNLSQVEAMEQEFPGEEYASVLEFNFFPEGYFLSLDSSNNETSVEVYQGELEARNDDDVLTIKKYEKTNISGKGLIDEPQKIEKTIVMLQSNDSVEGSISSGGKNLLGQDNVQHFPFQGMDYFVIPNTDEITMELTGKTDGHYSVSFIKLSEGTSKSYTVETTGSLKTTDTFVFQDEKLAIQNMEKGKTYDIKISHEDTSTGNKSSFKASQMKTSRDDQKFSVTDWGKLNDTKEKPVKFKQGDKEVGVNSGATGNEVQEDISEKEDEGANYALWIIVIAIIAVIIGVFVMVYWEDKI